MINIPQSQIKPWSISGKQLHASPSRMCAGTGWWCTLWHLCSYVTSLQDEGEKKKMKERKKERRAEQLCDLISKSRSDSGDEKPPRFHAGLISTSWNGGASPAVIELLRPLRGKKKKEGNFIILLLQRFARPSRWLTGRQRTKHMPLWPLPPVSCSNLWGIRGKKINNRRSKCAFHKSARADEMRRHFQKNASSRKE